MLLLWDTWLWCACFKADRDVVPASCSSCRVLLGLLPLLLCPTSWHSPAGAALLQVLSCWSWWLSNAAAGFCSPEFVEGYFQPEGGLSKTPHMQTVGSSSPATASSPFMVFQQLQGTARQQLVGALSPAAPWGCSLAVMQEWGSLSLNIPCWNGGVPVPFTSRSCINQVRK